MESRNLMADDCGKNAAAGWKHLPREKGEAGEQRRPTREFLGYTSEIVDLPRRDGRGSRKVINVYGHALLHGDGGDVTNDYRAAFPFSPETLARLRDDAELRERALRELAELRREVDERPFALIPEWSTKHQGEFRPKWVYHLGGRRHEEAFPLEAERGGKRPKSYENMPAELVQEIKSNPGRYYESEAYGKWFYRARARKREEAIARFWEERERLGRADGRTAVEKNASVESSPALPTSETAQPAKDEVTGNGDVWCLFGTASHEATQEEMERGVRSLVMQFGGLIGNRHDAERLSDSLVAFAIDGLTEQARRAGGELTAEGRYPERRLPIIRRAVRRELLRLCACVRNEETSSRDCPPPVIMTEDEVDFIEEHPELAISGVSIREGNDGTRRFTSITRRLNQDRAEQDLRELLEAAVADAMRGVETPLGDARRVNEALTCYILKYLSGPERLSQQGERFRQTLLDIENDHAVIRNYEYLAGVVQRLAKAMEL